MKIKREINRCILLSGLCLLCVTTIFAQTFPKEGDKLNYRLVGFQLLNAPGTLNYEVELAQGSITAEADFARNIIRKAKATTNHVKMEVPAFGAAYTWRGVYTNTKGVVIRGDLAHFSTLTCPNVDTAIVRLRILQKTLRYADAYVFSDIAQVLYDLKGNPVWFLPPLTTTCNATVAVRDLKLTKEGTITCLVNDWPYEIDYNGNILWQPQHGLNEMGERERYHHEFTRTDGDNYLVLGNEMLKCKLNTNKDSLPTICDNSEQDGTPKQGCRKLPFGTVLEYNSRNKLLWSWHSSVLFRDSTLYPFLRPGKPGFEIHLNSFYLDRYAGMLYVSSKRYSIIIKVKYPEGDVRAIYGMRNNSTTHQLFCDQHSVKQSATGKLYLFNNNECNPDNVPTIMMLEEAKTTAEGVKKIWELKTPVKPTARQTGDKHTATSGGNVIALPGGDVFASMSSPYGDMFIAGKDKKILWHGIQERKMDTTGKWEPQPQYRATLVTDAASIEKLLFHAAPPLSSLGK